MRKLIVTFALFLAAPAFGQQVEVRPEVRNLSDYTMLGRQMDTPEARSELVAALGEYCAALSARYPTNSPADDQWLASEFQSGDSDRQMRVFASAEFGRRSAYAFTSTCIRDVAYYEEYPQARAAILFSLIFELARFQPDAELHARNNGLNPNVWGFILLDNAIEALSKAGMFEAAVFIPEE